MDLFARRQTDRHPLLALGHLLDGETTLAPAGFAAYERHLHFSTVITIATIAGCVVNQVFFWLGRRHGERMLALSVDRDPADRMHGMIERWHSSEIELVRFAYGQHIADPVLIGTSDVAPWRFALFNAIGAAIWAPLLAGAGRIFGRAVETLLGDMHCF
jgi:membrane protein DedA with SNARE-associated domain